MEETIALEKIPYKSAHVPFFFESYVHLFLFILFNEEFFLDVNQILNPKLFDCVQNL